MMMTTERTGRKAWSREEMARVLELRHDGLSYAEIADLIRPSQKTAWRKVGSICREYDRRHSSIHGAPGEVTATLISMTREERVIHLMSKLNASARGKAISSALDDEQRRVFAEMYAENIHEFDSLTSAEDQMLMQAILAYCQYLKAAQMSAESERAYLANIRGELDDDDPRKQLAGVTDRYKREMDQKHKEYVTLIDKLKATRDQRLKLVTDQRKTFGELQREFISKKRKKSIVQEIMSIDRMTDDEIKRMLKGEVGSDGEVRPWLLGDIE